MRVDEIGIIPVDYLFMLCKLFVACFLAEIKEEEKTKDSSAEKSDSKRLVQLVDHCSYFIVLMCIT